jgi:hypothetical protein
MAEYMCGVCHEDLLIDYALGRNDLSYLTPCQHRFCELCVKRLDKCAMCKSTFKFEDCVCEQEDTRAAASAADAYKDYGTASYRTAMARHAVLEAMNNRDRAVRLRKELECLREFDWRSQCEAFAYYLERAKVLVDNALLADQLSFGRDFNPMLRCADGTARDARRVSDRLVEIRAAIDRHDNAVTLAETKLLAAIENVNAAYAAECEADSTLQYRSRVYLDAACNCNKRGKELEALGVAHIFDWQYGHFCHSYPPSAPVAKSDGDDKSRSGDAVDDENPKMGTGDMASSGGSQDREQPALK